MSAYWPAVSMTDVIERGVSAVMSSARMGWSFSNFRLRPGPPARFAPWSFEPFDRPFPANVSHPFHLVTFNGNTNSGCG